MQIHRVRFTAALGCCALAASFLFGCQAKPSVRTQLAPGANLAQYKTYDYFDKLSTDKRGYTTILTRNIEGAVDREMQARGYVRGPNPDLKVNFNVQRHDKVRSTPDAGYGVGFGGWRSGFGYGWGGGFAYNDIETVTEGTLTLDLVDRSRKELVWTGSATGVISKSVEEHPQRAVDTAVTSIFAKYPIVGTSGAPAQ